MPICAQAGLWEEQMSIWSLRLLGPYDSREHVAAWYNVGRRPIASGDLAARVRIGHSGMGGRVTPTRGEMRRCVAPYLHPERFPQTSCVVMGCKDPTRSANLGPTHDHNSTLFRVCSTVKGEVERCQIHI